MLQQKKSFVVSEMISTRQNAVFTYQSVQIPSAQSESKVHSFFSEVRVFDSAHPLPPPSSLPILMLVYGRIQRFGSVGNILNWEGKEGRYKK